MDLEISLEPRTALGKANRRLRRQGIVPGVVFGNGRESVPVQVDVKRLETLYRAAGRTSIVQLKVGAARRPTTAIIKGIQRDPRSRSPLHVDFFVVDLSHEMQVDVPLVFVGEAPAVDATGGTLMTNLDHLKVRALPADLPHEITVDVSSLVDLDAAVHVRDVVVDGDAVHIVNDPDELVAKVIPPRIEVEPEAVAAEQPAEAEAAEGEAAPVATAEADGDRGAESGAA